MLFKFALLLTGATPSFANAGTPQPGKLLEGLCQDSVDGSLELLQKRMDKAPSALAVTVNESSATGPLALAQNSSHANASAAASLIAANASVGDLPFGIGNIVNKVKNVLPDGVSDAISGVAVDGFVSLLNSTLQLLQVQADGFLAHCTEYKDNLLGNVSAGSDQAIAALQASVAANIGPVQQLWVKISDAIVQVLPPLSAALTAIGQDDIASTLVSVVGKATSVITEVLNNSTSIIAGVANTTQAEKDAALAKLSATIDKGLATVDSFEADLVGVLQGALDRLAKTLGITVLAVTDVAPSGTREKLAGLLEQIQTWVKTLADGLRTAFTGTLESTEVALSPPSKKSGAAAQATVGLFLAAVCTSLI